MSFPPPHVFTAFCGDNSFFQWNMGLFFHCRIHYSKNDICKKYNIFRSIFDFFIKDNELSEKNFLF